MCGIAGFWDFKRRLSDDEATEALRTVTDTIASRGPDGAGYHYEEKAGLAFGHRRLSIVDLSAAGAQPMQSANGRYVMTYNGEIFNTVELKQLLASVGKVNFRGHSDTEILIESIDSFGIQKTLEMTNGMFAFALYDRAEECMYLAMDHIGVKPLYWAYQNGCLFFGSTLAPIMRHPLFKKSLNADCLADYFSYNTIPAPQTILQDCYKIKPGHFLTFHKDKPDPVETRYWQLPTVDQIDTKTDFHDLLMDAVGRQMMADVPLGVFLSGGIDSTLITALMQAQSAVPVRSFTIGFEEASHDESPYAAAVAAHLKTDHTQEILSLQRAKDLIAGLPDAYDEPFADSSQLPSLLLCRMAKKHVTVCLSGDGGDELFAGYSRYFYGQKAYRNADRIRAYPWMGQVLSCLSAEWVNRLPFAPDNLQTKLTKLALMAQTSDGYTRNKIMVDLWVENPAYVPHQFAYDTDNSTHCVDMMRRADMQCYLPDDILHKMDRASMAHGLEVRVPYLDPRVIEAAFKMPVSSHYCGKTGKVILRDVLRRYVPDSLIDRPKSGFSVPVAQWLRNDWRDLVSLYMTKDRLEEGGYLNADMILKRVRQHQAGTHNWQHSLWGVLMLQMWRQAYRI